MSTMGYYKILSQPMSPYTRDYKGLYRVEPFPPANHCKRFMALWQQYVQHYETAMGVSTELTLEELMEFAALATKTTGDPHEVIFFSNTCECPHPAEYYGIDVTGYGGYSMVGGNFFLDSETKADGILGLYDVINCHFRSKLNHNGLFSTYEDAASFCTVLNDLNALSPGCVETEEWRVVHIFKIVGP